MHHQPLGGKTQIEIMGLRKRLVLRSESEALGTEGGRLSNKDMDPIPLGSPERTWGWPSLLGFWIAEAFSISMYQGVYSRCLHHLLRLEGGH